MRIRSQLTCSQFAEARWPWLGLEGSGLPLAAGSLAAVLDPPPAEWDLVAIDEP